MVIDLDLFKQETIKLGNIEVDSDNFVMMVEEMPDGVYRICSLKEEDREDPCVPMFKGGIRIRW